MAVQGAQATRLWERTHLLSNGLLSIAGQLELETPQLALQLRRGVPDLGPALALRDRLLRLVVEVIVDTVITCIREGLSYISQGN